MSKSLAGRLEKLEAKHAPGIKVVYRNPRPSSGRAPTSQAEIDQLAREGWQVSVVESVAKPLSEKDDNE